MAILGMNQEGTTYNQLFSDSKWMPEIGATNYTYTATESGVIQKLFVKSDADSYANLKIGVYDGQGSTANLLVQGVPDTDEGSGWYSVDVSSQAVAVTNGLDYHIAIVVPVGETYFYTGGNSDGIAKSVTFSAELTDPLGELSVNGFAPCCYLQYGAATTTTTTTTTAEPTTTTTTTTTTAAPTTTTTTTTAGGTTTTTTTTTTTAAPFARNNRLIVDSKESPVKIFGEKRLASWNTSGRPSNPKSFVFGYNTTLGALDIYTGVSWVQISIDI
jgi:hypothetical protein